MAKQVPSARKRTKKRGDHKPATTAPKGTNSRRTFTLATLKPPMGSRKKKVRVGRGMGSKLGKTAGSGNKGKKSRRGYSRRRGCRLVIAALFGALARARNLFSHRCYSTTSTRCRTL